MLSPTDPDLAGSYNNIGYGVYTTWESIRKHCPTTTKSLISRQKTLPANHPDLASSYNNIGCGVLVTWESTRKHCPTTTKALDILTENSSWQSSFIG